MKIKTNMNTILEIMQNIAYGQNIMVSIKEKEGKLKGTVVFIDVNTAKIFIGNDDGSEDKIISMKEFLDNYIITDIEIYK